MNNEQTAHLIHTTRPGDRWDLIAYDYFGDASKSHVVIAANRDLFVEELVPIPPVLSAGLKLVIPVIEQAEMDESLLPPWKRKEPIYG